MTTMTTNILQRHTLQSFLEETLACTLQTPDYAPNGLQVEGTPNIQHIVTGVTASQALIDAAIQKKAQAILVHHGYFWPGENPNITGIHYQRISKLIKHDINLWAYHLPLDLHPLYGNNVQLAQRLGFTNFKPALEKKGVKYGLLCEIPKTSLQTLNQHIENTLNRRPICIAAGSEPYTVYKVAICTGAAQDLITQAHAAGADVYISGEISERTTHIARELNIHYIAAGHHATERYGIQALGKLIEKNLQVPVSFIDIANPV